ncbi:MAG: RNA-binding protein [Proteobacteria bacterium]|nr:MAG: RNA-binding protein [Pseudomonadota bacterium]
MKKTLFVAGLDFSINDSALNQLFAQFGTVASAKVITDKFSGKSRGFGFVEMATVEEAQECIKQLNDSIHMNRTLAVKNKEDKPASSNGGARNNGGFSRRW